MDHLRWAAHKAFGCRSVGSVWSRKIKAESVSLSLSQLFSIFHCLSSDFCSPPMTCSGWILLLRSICLHIWVTTLSKTWGLCCLYSVKVWKHTINRRWTDKDMMKVLWHVCTAGLKAPWVQGLFWFYFSPKHKIEAEFTTATFQNNCACVPEYSFFWFMTFLHTMIKDYISGNSFIKLHDR